MDNDDPFQNFGLDFRSIRGYLSKPYVQFPDNEYERMYVLGADAAPTPSSASTYVGHSGPADTSSSDRGRILFLSGYPTPEQVDRLTKAHNIDPEFWRRHLAASAPTFEDIKLPSACCDIFQLPFWTVASWVNTFNRDHISVQSLRKEAEVEMGKYRDTLKSLASWRPGDSVVRNYEIHDRDHFSIEQVVTMYVLDKRDGKSNDNGSTWLAIICSDCGRDLAQSPSGPWLGDSPGEAGHHVRTFPVPEHRMWASSYAITTNSVGNNTKTKSSLRAIPQSLANLSKANEIGQDFDSLHEDPTYALNRVFSFFVCSEAYFLSFMASQIERSSSSNKGTPDVADEEVLSNLLHCRQLLERHEEELRHGLRTVRARSSSSDAIQAASSSLEQDLVYLTERAFTLKNRSETSISLFMNVASIGEARRSVQQNKLLFRFTVIVSIYVPLSFVASVFGMNFSQFGQGKLSIWIYFVVSVPVLLVSALFLFVNPKVMLNALPRSIRDLI